MVTGTWSGKDRIASTILGEHSEDRNTALRQEDVEQRKQRLIRDEKRTAILSPSETKRELEKATKYRNSQRSCYNATACCHRMQTLK